MVVMTAEAADVEQHKAVADLAVKRFGYRYLGARRWHLCRVCARACAELLEKKSRSLVPLKRGTTGTRVSRTCKPVFATQSVLDHYFRTILLKKASGRKRVRGTGRIARPRTPLLGRFSSAPGRRLG